MLINAGAQRNSPRRTDRRGASWVVDTLRTMLRRPVGRIRWAGAETADERTGFLNGAVCSGQLAATEVAAPL